MKNMHRITIIALLSVVYLYASIDTQKEEFRRLIKDIEKSTESNPYSLREKRQIQKPELIDIAEVPNADKNLSSASFYLKSTSRLVLPIILFKDRELRRIFSEKAKPYFSIAYYTVPSDPYMHYPISVVFPVKYKDDKVYIAFTKEKEDRLFLSIVVHMPKEGVAEAGLQKKIEQCISKSLYDTQSKTIFEQCGVTPWSGARWIEF